MFTVHQSNVILVDLVAWYRDFDAVDKTGK